MKKGKILLIAAALIVVGGVYGRNATPPAAPTAKPTAIATPTPRPATVRPSAVVSLAERHGQRITIAEDTGPLRCDYNLDNTRRASVVWTDGAQVYTISGDPNSLGLLYMDMLALDAWQSCSYSIKGHDRCGYGGAEVADLYGTVEDYSMAFQKISGVAPTPAPTPIKFPYILNRETKVFHKPGCHVAPKSKKKREEVTAARDQVIANGYEPCNVCNP